MTADEFWSNIDKSVDCWNWTRSKKGKGYGCAWYEGKSWKANRLAWTLVNGPIPKGMDVLHKCDNPLCCNPGHLFLGTQSDNCKDMIAKGRQPHSWYKSKARHRIGHVDGNRGEGNGYAKLTAEQVRDVAHIGKRRIKWTLTTRSHYSSGE